MAADTKGRPQSAGLPCGCVVLLLVGGVFWSALAAWGPRRVVLGLVPILVGAVLLRVGWRRWFPHRATRELNKVIANVPGRARVIRRKCRRLGRYEWEIAWKVPTGVTVPGLKRTIPVFEAALDCSCDFWFERGYMRMRAGTAQLPASIRFEDFYLGERSRATRPAGDLVVGLGFGRTGNVWVDLVTVPHVLKGGTPGSGKSVGLRQMLVGLMLEYGPDHLQVVLVDLKGGMEFWFFRELPHLMMPVVCDLPELAPALARLLAELDRRMTLFRNAGVVSLGEWNRTRPDDRLPYVVVAVDEFGEVSRPVADAANDKERARAPKAQAHASFSRLARLGRAVGIHLLLCTQRPDADVMPGQIKDQLPATLALRTRSETNSHILLGDKNGAAAMLAPIKGRAVWQWETECEVQVPFIEPTEAVALLVARWGGGHALVTQCPPRTESDGRSQREAA